jgi:GT2 family glycosyltransferase
MNRKKTNIKKVCAIVVTYNRLDLLKECIEALRTQTYAVEKILVINNGSSDGTMAWLLEQQDLWAINQENVGGAGGFYRGIKEASKKGFDWLWLMDDDVIVDSTGLFNLLDVEKTLKKVGFLCSHIKDDEGTVVNVPTIDMSVGKSGYVTWGEYLDKKIIKVREATFVSVLIPQNVVDEIGLPIKEFFIWGDDIEYTRRISKKYKGYLIGSSSVIHRRAQKNALNIVIEDNLNRIELYYYLYRNTMFLKKVEKKQLETAVFIYKSCRQIIKCISCSKNKIKKVKIIIRGLMAGITFNPIIEGVNKNV